MAKRQAKKKTRPIMIAIPDDVDSMEKIVEWCKGKDVHPEILKQRMDKIVDTHLIQRRRRV